MAVRPGHRKSHSTSALSTIVSATSSSSSSSTSGSASSAISSATAAAAARRRNRASQHPALGRVEERDGPSSSGSRRDIAAQGGGMEGSASMVDLPGLSRSRSTRTVISSSRRDSADDQPSTTEMEDTSTSRRGSATEDPVSHNDHGRQPVAGQDELEMRLAKALGDRARKQAEESKDRTGLQRTKSRKSVVREGNEDDVRTWMREILSLRSSDRRRREALKGLERTLIACCGRNPESGQDGQLNMVEFVALKVHDSLVTLLSRHAQTLSRYRVSLAPGDETALALCPEISSIVEMLQGLALLSRECKAALGQFWIMEVTIDLLLLLRSQPAIPSLVSVEGTESRPIAYSILDLLCCVLVDSPANARTFEELSGLEAVTRVLKGEKTARDVKMKCLEFLYFYLLPEGSKPTRVVSSSSTSSSSSSDSQPYPGSPFTPVFTSDSDGRTTPTIMSSSRFHDLDIPFVPQTPQHPARHALGFPTPKHSRKVSGSLGATPSLAPVPGSPAGRSPMSKSAGLDGRPSTREDRPVSRNSNVSTGSRDERPWSAMDLPNGAGLGFGLTKSSSVVNISDRRAGPVSPADPFLTDSRSSSGSSTAKPPNTSVGSNTPTSADSSSTALSSRLSRSSTQPNFGAEIKVDSANVTARRPSIKRAQKSSTPSVPSSTSSTDSPRRLIAQSRTTEGPDGVAMPRPPKIRHSRTQSHLSGLDRQSMPPPASIPPRKSSGEVDHARRPSFTPSTTPDGQPMLKSSSLLSVTPDQSAVTSSETPRPGVEPRPSPAKRAFPSGMTKGLPPSISTPNFSNMSRLSTSSQSGSTTPGLVPPSSTSTPLGANVSGASSTPGGANSSAQTSTPGGANLSASSASISSANTSSSSGMFSPNGGAGMPLGALRRIPSASDRRSRSRDERANGGTKGVRSVEEKKAMLGSWLGNVDALVENVEKVGFLGNRLAK